MKKRLFWVVPLCIILLLCAFGVGYFAGDNRAYSSGIERLRFETAGNVAYRVEALSRLRTGDVDGAITLIEDGMDQGIRTIPMQQEYSELPGASQRALMIAKLYRTAFPSQSPDIAESLAEVPLISPDHEYCSPALAAIAESVYDREP